MFAVDHTEARWAAVSAWLALCAFMTFGVPVIHALTHGVQP